MYYATKTYTSIGSCSFRQWRAAHSHCKYLHGYSFTIKLTFASETLDDTKWVIDFGGLKPIKQWLENLLDHTTIAAADDPLIDEFYHLDKIGLIRLRVLPDTGCEALARYIHDHIKTWLRMEGRSCHLNSVEVREQENNSAIYEGNVI